MKPTLILVTVARVSLRSSWRAVSLCSALLLAPLSTLHAGSVESIPLGGSQSAASYLAHALPRWATKGRVFHWGKTVDLPGSLHFHAVPCAAWANHGRDRESPQFAGVMRAGLRRAATSVAPSSAIRVRRVARLSRPRAATMGRACRPRRASGIPPTGS